MMQQVQFANHEALAEKDGTGLGWFHARHNGYDSYGHGGDWEGAAANIVLIPELNLGVTVVYNQHTAGENAIQYDLVNSVVNEFFSPSENLVVPETNTNISVDHVVGAYRRDRMVHNNAGKLNMFSDERSIVSNGDGTISIDGINASWLPVSETYFIPSSDNDVLPFDLAFSTDANGEATYLHIGIGNNSFQRLNWYD
ncbi:MAG: beta-lactamase family protein, partial [Gammaproteobacteria bacterium]|nr:beta-lactamase family protein [Gammaproteobacteria bacterium]